MLLSFQPKQIIIESTCDFDHGFAFVSLVESVVHATKNEFSSSSSASSYSSLLL